MTAYSFTYLPTYLPTYSPTYLPTSKQDPVVNFKLAKESGALLCATVGDDYAAVTHVQRSKHPAKPKEVEDAVSFALGCFGAIS